MKRKSRWHIGRLNYWSWFFSSLWYNYVSLPWPFQWVKYTSLYNTFIWGSTMWLAVINGILIEVKWVEAWNVLTQLGLPLRLQWLTVKRTSPWQLLPTQPETQTEGQSGAQQSEPTVESRAINHSRMKSINQTISDLQMCEHEIKFFCHSSWILGWYIMISLWKQLTHTYTKIIFFTL